MIPQRTAQSADEIRGHAHSVAGRVQFRGVEITVQAHEGSFLSPPNVVMNDEQPSPEADTTSSCGSADAQTAFSEAVSQVSPWGTIGWELFDSSGYDPCASLSWETLMIEGGTSSSPFHIMLFNHGEYLGTATAKPYGFAPTIERVSDSEIAVTYHWPREGEGNANRSGTTDAGFRWDEGQQKVIMSGDVPPTSLGS